MFSRYVYLAALLFCVACTTPTSPPELATTRGAAFPALQGWKEENHAAALEVFLKSCPALTHKAQPMSSGTGLQITPHQWQSLCDDGARARGNETSARQFFERRFAPYQMTNNNEPEGLFTGYYEPLLYGSRKKSGDFIYPIYMPPSDLDSSKPYYTRTEIEKGALAGRHLELVWVEDPVMLFFLHVQGSGRIIFADGSQMRVGFAGKNNQPYMGLGKVFADESLLPKDQINFFTLRQWLNEHPQQATAIMRKNPRYVFFKESKGAGPMGTFGAVLTPERSLAVDSTYVPYGLPLFLSTKLPSSQDNSPLAIHRLMFAQDTGTAIHGPVRGDIFFGAGQTAEYRAGMMKNLGSYMLLVPREVTYQLR